MLYEVITPTNDLITAPEILFFWVARMIIAGYEYQGTRPFRNVYLTGLVRDQFRRKMSKSLGRITSYNVCYTKLLRERNIPFEF